MPGPLDGVRRAIHDARDKIHGAGEDIRTLAGDMGGLTHRFHEEVSSEEAPPTEPKRSRLTNDETIAYQNREIAKHLWQLENHLAQGCRIPDSNGVPQICDCCEKGTFIAGLAYETIPIAERGGRPSAVYDEIARWCEDLDPMATVEAVESGQYDYKKLSGQCSALRKKLMGSTSLKSMLPPSPQE
jgi:hypothetical protein